MLRRRFPDHIAGGGLRIAVGIDFALDVVFVLLLDELIDRRALGEKAFRFHIFFQRALIIWRKLAIVLFEQSCEFSARLKFAARFDRPRMPWFAAVIAVVSPFFGNRWALPNGAWRRLNGSDGRNLSRGLWLLSWAVSGSKRIDVLLFKEVRG